MAEGKKLSLEEMRGLLNMKKEPEVELGSVKLNDDGSIAIYNTTLEALGDSVKENAITKMKGGIVQAVAKATATEVETLRAELVESQQNTHNDLLALAESTRKIEVKSPKGNKKLDGVQHNMFKSLLTIVGVGQAALMVGPAGTGKTHGAAKVAEALGLSFHSISVGSQTSKSDLQGYLTATGTYVRTQFREAYEHGGVFLLDEADAGNSNVLILLNAALSNGYMAFPDGMIHAHDDFRMIATANTFGHGANRQYVGRNQLDAATLDRFTVVVWDIDARVEESMAGTEPDGKKWLTAVRAVRHRAEEELALRVVISPRATQRGAQLLAAGMAFEEVLEHALVGNFPAGSKDEFTNVAKAAWNKS